MTRRNGPGVPLRIGERVVGTVTNWELNVNRDYVDATAFGDTNRTYLVGLRDVEGTFTGTFDGTTETTMRFRFPWGTRVQTDTTTQELTITPEPETTGGRIYGNTYANLYFNHDWDTRWAVTSTDNTWLNGVVQIPATMTPEQFEAQRARIEEARLAVVQRDKEAKEALAKAKQLLESHLDKRQLAQWKKNRQFDVKGEVLVYRIDQHGGVCTLDPFGTFCAYPYSIDKGTRVKMPGPDQALAAKLLIENDEKEYLRIANWSGSYGSEYNGISLGRMNINGVPHGKSYSSSVYGQPKMRDRKMYPVEEDDDGRDVNPFGFTYNYEQLLQQFETVNQTRQRLARNATR